MLATESVSIRPYNRGDDDFIAALARDAFDEFSPHAVLHTLGMVRRCTTLIALRDLTPPRELGEGELVDAGRAGGPPRRRRVGFAAFADEGEGVLLLRLGGTCHGCAASTITLKQGIESRLREMVPEVKQVLAV